MSLCTISSRWQEVKRCNLTSEEAHTLHAI